MNPELEKHLTTIIVGLIIISCIASILWTGVYSITMLAKYYGGTP